MRRLSEEKRRVVGEEIARLLAAGFIMEVFFPEWLANPVLVLKKNKQWRMCIDYMSLNKACPKDPFALPRIDQMIDSTAGCELLSFLDAYTCARLPANLVQAQRDYFGAHTYERIDKERGEFFHYNWLNG